LVLGELYYGAHRSQQPAKALTQICEFLRSCVLLFPDEQTPDHYGRIKAGLARAGTPIPENDIWIAALAQESQLPLLTRDRHFALIPGLTLVTW
jgi:tRNA(fMet)-specific endonuclease VapC